MSIAQELAEVLHRMNALLAHREESGKLEIGQAIDSLAAKVETEEPATPEPATPEGGETV